MRITRLVVPAVSVLATLAALQLYGVRDVAAVSTRSFTTATYREFDEGETERALITSLGEVLPGQATERVDLETSAAWCAVRGSDGTVYAGSIADGTIYAVNGDKKRVVATLDKDTPWIGALALDGGTLYAGTLGSATIWKVDSKGGKPSALVKLDGADHIWALAFDASGKTLYAGTGPDGKLFAVDLAAGKAKVIWESGEKHLLAVTRAGDGALWIGTAEEAILYRFDPKTSQARAMADFAGSELKAVVEVNGAFIVVSNEFDQKVAAPPAPPPAKGPKGTPAKPPEAGAAPGADKPDPAKPAERKGKGGVFRVEPDGRVEQLHALPDSYFTSLAATADGTIYAGAGTQGRVYQIRPDRTVVTLFDVAERQVNAIMAWDAGIAFVTGDGGATYFSAGPAKDAAYTSKVFDAGFPARWGNLRFRGDGVTVSTRSGNTAKPSKGWSAWEALGPRSTQGNTNVGAVKSPGARYVQYKVTLDAAGKATSVLRDVTVYYLPQNQRPRVTDITVGDDPAAAAKKPPVTTATGPSKPRSPIVKLKWKVENPDEDELVYDLSYRPEGEVEWRDLPTGSDPLIKTEFDWNTEALPDGYYRLRVSASDSRANPPNVAMEHSYVSTPFLVDNQKPQVQNLTVKLPAVSGLGQDSFSRIDEIAWSLDGGEWTMVYPTDGIFDSIAESFSLKLPKDLAAGAHTLSIRVADEADNIGSASTTFRVGK